MSGWFRRLGEKKPWAQGCVVFCAGCVLAVSGCFGFLMSLNFGGGPTRPLREAIGLGLGALFVLGALALPTGFVWSIVGLVRANKRREALEKASVEPPPPPPPSGQHEA